MINIELLKKLHSYYKATDLLQNYDTSPNKLTANNYNCVLSAIELIASNGILLSTLLSSTINANCEQLLNNIKVVSTLLYEIILNLTLPDEQNWVLSANYASSAISAALTLFASSALFAETADYSNHAERSDIAKQIEKQLVFVSNSNDIISYNGSEDVRIDSILSSYYSEESINSHNALSAEYAELSNHSISADNSIVANRLNSKLLWFNIKNEDIDMFDGSSDAIISSVLYSLSSQIASLSLYSISADFDSNNNLLNTKVEYVFSLDLNNDYPILFSEEKTSNILTNQKYKVKYHLQININPYLGAIKANYFIGTAVSATYAICDMNSNLVNTRVCQNSTNNNYEYPITLSFIDADGNPADGKNNLLLYAYNMRINPYNDVIFTKANPSNDNDIDYSIYHGTNNREIEFDILGESHTHKYINLQQNINLVGLATRAICDLYGYKVNKSTFTYKNEKDYEMPMLFSASASIDEGEYFNTTETRDAISYSNKITVNPSNGNMKISGAFLSSGGIIAGSSINTSGNFRVYDYIECGIIDGETSLDNNVALLVHKNAQIDNNLCVGLPTYKNSSINIYGLLSANTDIYADRNLNIQKDSMLGFYEDSKIVTSGSILVGCSAYIDKNMDVNGILNVYGTNESRINGSLYVKTDVTALNFNGVATCAKWADLAEVYLTDVEYPIGTLIRFGGLKLITIATNLVNGVISDKPAYLMNSCGNGQPIALVGRVYVRVTGKANKFDYISLSDIPGVGKSIGNKKTNNIIGRALHDKNIEKLLLLLCVIKLEL